MVDLFASPYPHRRWRRVSGRAFTGSVVFRPRPDLNTRYQLRLAKHPRVRSRPLMIYVDLGDREMSASLLGCAKGLLAKGFGHPSPSDPGCGRRVLRATKRRMSTPG